MGSETISAVADERAGAMTGALDLEIRDGRAPIKQLADALGVPRRTLDRVCDEEGIERVKYRRDRRSWVGVEEIRRALDGPQRRPQRKARPGAQPKDGRGRFSPLAFPGPD